jgi:hypothetical protein
LSTCLKRATLAEHEASGFVLFSAPKLRKNNLRAVTLLTTGVLGGVSDDGGAVAVSVIRVFMVVFVPAEKGASLQPQFQSSSASVSRWSSAAVRRSRLEGSGR